MLPDPASPFLAVLALLFERAAGYPERLFRLIGHPVTWMGALIGRLDRDFNHGESRAMGILALLVLMTVAGTAALVLERAIQLALPAPIAIVALAVAASSLFAQKSLASHVARVADALEQGGLAEGRKAVAQVVGRDTAELDEAGVSRAAIESLAENFSDAVVAPTFWLTIGGLAGGTLYKAINTADSMIGHLTPRHRDFGWAAARLDDLVNWPASRLSALAITLAGLLVPGADPGEAWDTVRRDARHHRSPNAGWPEAAMAGALRFRLAGPRFYGGVPTFDRSMGDGRADLGPADIRKAISLYRSACHVLWAALAGLAITLWALRA